MTFHEILLQQRKCRGLSQEELAAQLGVSRQAVSKWETGEASPDLGKLIALSRTLDISLDVLCGLQEAAAENAVPADAMMSAAPHRSPVRWAVAALVLITLLVGAFLLGRQTAPAAEAPPVSAELPESISVTGLGFSPEADGVAYQFTPSYLDPACTYQIAFAAAGEQPVVCDAVAEGGVCSGRAVLNAWGSYTVTVTVSNGLTSRAVAVADNLSYTAPANGENGVWGGGRCSWTPLP